MYEIGNYTSFKIPTKANQLVLVSHPDDISKLNLSITDNFVVLGEGSNTFFANDYNGIVLINKIKSITINDLGDCAYITAGAGDNWHYFVSKVSSLGYYGLENLAYIPGTVGAAPVQNIGAYGEEVAKFIDNVVVYDIYEQTIKQIQGSECEFGYRDSKFKTVEWQQRYIIIAVTFVLEKTFNANLSYYEIKKIFSNQDCTPAKLLDAIVRIRKAKLPNHNEIPNVGSFFKNPIISTENLSTLQNKYNEIPYFAIGGNVDNQQPKQVKIPAAWLIDKLNFKGFQHKGAAVYDQHALILINNNNANAKDIIELAIIITNAVKQEFDISLEIEARIIY